MQRVALVLFFVVTIVAEAHFSMQGPGSAHERLASGYWSDPSTSLMWTAKDNGKNRAASRSCPPAPPMNRHKSRLAATKPELRVSIQNSPV
jgi:hypothetical protein